MTAIDALIYHVDFQVLSHKSRRKFTPQEDETLKYLIFQLGEHNWVKISEYMPGRTAKQCRDRFCNYLSEPHSQEPWKPEEDEILLKYLSIIGSKWVKISKHIPGRSGNDVKNRWYKHLCKKFSFIKENNFYTPQKTDIGSSSSPIEKTQIDNESNLDKLYQQYTISALLI